MRTRFKAKKVVNSSANKLHVKIGDNVLVLSGKDKNKKGKILELNKKTQMAKIEGINIVTKHQKPTGQEKIGGLIKKETFISICKVKVVCPSCSAATRTGRKILDDNKHFRYCKKCSEVIE